MGLWMDGESNVSKMLIAALRKATDVNVFIKSGETKLECVDKSGSLKRGPFRMSEPPTAEFKVSGGISPYKTTEYQTATWVCLRADGVIKALSLILREGDRVFFRSYENNNGYMEAAVIPAGKMESQYHGNGYTRLHHDELAVSVMRPRVKRGGRLVMEVLVRDLVLSCTVCPDNTARPLR